MSKRHEFSPAGRRIDAEPNIQNIPIRTEIGRSIRDAFQREFNTRVNLDLDALLDDLPFPYKRKDP